MAPEMAAVLLVMQEAAEVKSTGKGNGKMMNNNRAQNRSMVLLGSWSHVEG